MLVAFLLTDSSELDPAGLLVCDIQDLANLCLFWLISGSCTQNVLNRVQFTRYNTTIFYYLTVFFRIEKLLRYWSALSTLFMNLLYWTTAQFLYSYIRFSAFPSCAHHFWHVDHACHSHRSLIFAHLNNYITFLQNDGCPSCFWLPVLGCGMHLFTSIVPQLFFI
jgi:hypothetical protein